METRAGSCFTPSNEAGVDRRPGMFGAVELRLDRGRILSVPSNRTGPSGPPPLIDVPKVAGPNEPSDPKKARHGPSRDPPGFGKARAQLARRPPGSSLTLLPVLRRHRGIGKVGVRENVEQAGRVAGERAGVGKASFSSTVAQRVRRRAGRKTSER